MKLLEGGIRQMLEREFINRLGQKIFYRVWPVENAKATIHIYHGMAEHSARYAEFAEYMNNEGFAVFCHDHMGHGNSLGEEGLKGYFNKKNGWEHASIDGYDIDMIINEEYKGIPHFIFGHSMGSFMVRKNIADHSDIYDAAVICGTGGSQGAIGVIGKGLASFKQALFGAKHKDMMLNVIIFGGYNAKFKSEGPFAWLSKDREMVEKYIADPLCGFTCTSSFYKDLIGGTIIANDPAVAKKIRKDLPILLISGEDDPVGNYSKGVEQSCKLYKDAGIEDVRLALIKNGRHEILNDDTKHESLDIIAGFYREFLSE